MSVRGESFPARNEKPTVSKKRPSPTLKDILLKECAKLKEISPATANIGREAFSSSTSAAVENTELRTPPTTTKHSKHSKKRHGIKDVTNQHQNKHRPGPPGGLTGPTLR